MQKNIAMDWFSWLSNTTLEPSLVYDYSLVFARNELQEADLTYFNHEFLQSMGISIAKHRLEILKLARKEIGRKSHALSRLFLAINKTRKCLTKCVSSKWDFRDDGAPAAVPSPTPYRQSWRATMTRRQKSSTEKNEERLMLTTVSPKVSGPLDSRVQEGYMVPNTRPKVVSGPLDGMGHERLMFTNRSPKPLSGPLDGRVHERLMLTSRSQMVSGPLDGKVQEQMMFTSRSPMVYGPQDGRVSSSKANGYGDYGVNSLWATLFEDMKPT